MNVAQLEARRRTLLDEAHALATKPNATDEDRKAADDKLAEAEKLKAEIAVAKSQEARLQRIQSERDSLPPTPTTLNAGLPTPAHGVGARLAAMPRSYQLRAFKGLEGGDRAAYALGCYAASLALAQTDQGAALRFHAEAEKLGFTGFAGLGSRDQLAMTTGSPTAGGVLVQEAIGTAIFRLIEENGVFRRSAFPVPMGTADVIKWPYFTAGVTVAPVKENTERTESTPTVNEAEVVARDWGSMALFSRKIDSNAMVALGELIATELGLAFAAKEDAAGFVGDGTSAYNGIQGIATKIAMAAHSASVVTAATGHDTFEELTLADWNKVIAALPNFIGSAPKWYMSKACWAAGLLPLVQAQTMSDGASLTFQGYPVEWVEVLPRSTGSVASQIIALFGDLRLCAMYGAKNNLRIERSDHRYFEKDMAAVKGEMSFGVTVYRLGDTTNAGPVIALKAAA